MLPRVRASAANASKTQQGGRMLYEMRVYHSVPGRLPALHKRFEESTLKM
jgi:hypothetical protein